MKNVGRFEVEEILICLKETPILFTARYDDYGRYLFLARNYSTSEYAFIKVSNQDLIEMLNGKITLRQIFRKQRAIYMTYINSSDMKLKCRGYNSSEFPEELFPPDEYYNVNLPYIRRYESIIREEEVMNEYYDFEPCV